MACFGIIGLTKHLVRFGLLVGNLFITMQGGYSSTVDKFKRISDTLHGREVKKEFLRVVSKKRARGYSDRQAWRK